LRTPPNIIAFFAIITITISLGYFLISNKPKPSSVRASNITGIAATAINPPALSKLSTRGADFTAYAISFLGKALSSIVSLRLVNIISMLIGIGNLKLNIIINYYIIKK
jgi:hypothetical protein